MNLNIAHLVNGFLEKSLVSFFLVLKSFNNYFKTQLLEVIDTEFSIFRDNNVNIRNINLDDRHDVSRLLNHQLFNKYHKIIL